MFPCKVEAACLQDEIGIGGKFCCVWWDGGVSKDGGEAGEIFRIVVERV